MVVHVTVVANKLQPADHFSHGEETQYFRCENARGNHLLAVHVADARENRFGCEGAGGGCAGDQGRGIADGVQDGGEVGLEGCDIATIDISSDMQKRIPWRRDEHEEVTGSGGKETYGGVILRPWKTSLESSKPTLE